MEILFSFLNWVASFSHIDEESGSKMDIHNLATVITPNILYSSKKAEAGMDDSFLAIEAVHTLILCNEAMCEVGSWLIRFDLWWNTVDMSQNRFPKICCLYLMTQIYSLTAPTSPRKISSSVMEI